MFVDLVVMCLIERDVDKQESATLTIHGCRMLQMLEVKILHLHIQLWCM